MGVEDMVDIINQKLSPQNYGNADGVTAKIGSLNNNIDDFSELEIRGNNRTLNKNAAFHCYKMRNRSSYPQTWLHSGTDAVFSDAIKLTIVPVCDDDSPSGYISLGEKSDGSSQVEVKRTCMSGTASMPWMNYIVDKKSLKILLNENGIFSLTDIKCVLGTEEQAPDFIYLNTDKGEFVIPYFYAGNINYNGELTPLHDFLQSYSSYIESNKSLLPNYLNGGVGSILNFITWERIIMIFAFLGILATVGVVLFKKYTKAKKVQ